MENLLHEDMILNFIKPLRFIVSHLTQGMSAGVRTMIYGVLLQRWLKRKKTDQGKYVLYLLVQNNNLLAKFLNHFFTNLDAQGNK